jgi:uncharacterized glyoxalase superfamily protein PhnB
MKTLTGYQTTTPYLIVPDARKLISFLTGVFGAEETFCLPGSEGGVMHAEIRIGESTILLADARDEYKPTTAGLYVYVDDADETYRRALAAGAASLIEPKDKEQGVRWAGFTDPFGNNWWITTPLAWYCVLTVN